MNYFNKFIKYQLKYSLFKGGSKLDNLKDIFNIFFLLKVNVAYILDTSCSSNTLPGTTTNTYVELPEGIGHGKRRKKGNTKTKITRKKRKSKKRKGKVI